MSALDITTMDNVWFNSMVHGQRNPLLLLVVQYNVSWIHIKYHTFTSSGTFTANWSRYLIICMLQAVDGAVTVQIIGGCGGGAGGYLSGTTTAGASS